MKLRYLFFLITLLGCSENEETFLALNYVEIKSNFIPTPENPGSGFKVFGKDSIVSYNISSSSVDELFYTTEGFQTMEGSEVDITKYGNVVYYDFHNIVTFKQKPDTYLLYKSQDRGASFEYMGEVHAPSNHEAFGFVSFNIASFDAIYFLADCKFCPDGFNMNIYKYDGSKIDLIHQTNIPFSHRPANINFYSKDEGMVFLRPESNQGNFYYITTHDGGNTWSEIDSMDISDIKLNKVRDLSFNHLFINDEENFIFHKPGTWEPSFLYHSDNKGKKWVETFSGEVNNLQFLDKQTGFFTSNIGGDEYGDIDVLYKTTDGGKTWEQVEGSPFYTSYHGAYFYNDSIGVTNSAKILQHTYNGGKTWKLLFHPGL